MSSRRATGMYWSCIMFEEGEECCLMDMHGMVSEIGSFLYRRAEIFDFLLVDVL